MESTFKAIEFVKTKTNSKQIIDTFHKKAQTAVFKKNYKLYQSILQSIVLTHLPTMLLNGSEANRRGANTEDEQLSLEYYQLFEESFSMVIHQSWVAYMNKKYEKGDTIIFKFLMMFLTENFYESWKVSEPRSLIKTMVKKTLWA